MNDFKLLDFTKANLFPITLGVAILIVIVRAIVAGSEMNQRFETMGNDDIMRLLVVRDFIAGQGWFDTTQYRVVPPDGIDIHWSRYIDFGIASIIVPLSFFFSMDTAEQIAATVWPTLILIITLLILGFGSRRVFGTVTACCTVVCTVLWVATSSWHSSAGNLDHHNVQMLLIVILVYAVIWPNRPVTAGIVGGLAAGLSLAVGLETIVFVVVAGGLFLFQAAIGATPQSRKILLSFGITLICASLIFWAGQTAADDYAALVCDKLAIPVLGLVMISVTASILPMAIPRLRDTPVLYIAATVLVTIAGLTLFWPFLSICLDGPYGKLPVALQDYISERIVEARSGYVWAQSRPRFAALLLLPAVVVLLVAGSYFLNAFKAQKINTPEHKALGKVLIFCGFGICLVLYQMRTFGMTAAIIPIVAGFLFAHYTMVYIKTRKITDAAFLIIFGVFFFNSNVVNVVLEPYIPEPSYYTQDDCKKYNSMQSLNDIPPGIILAHGNYGSLILWATHHDVLGVLYHRGTEAMFHAFRPFQMDGDAMADYVRATNATHLLMCRGFIYESDFSNMLANGGDADWLRPVPVADENQILFEVLR